MTAGNDNGIWRDGTLIAREGSQAGGTPAGALFSGFNSPVLNDSGQTAFEAFLQNGPGGVTVSNSSNGIWRDATLVAREGSQAGGTPAGALFSGLFNPVLNDSGQTAFQGFLQTGAGGVTASNDGGIWLNGPNGDTLLVARKGDAFDGKTLSALVLSLASGGSDGRGRALNDFGQLAYEAQFTNGDEAVVLFTPDLHWFSSSSSTWDNRFNWTIAQAPGAVHEVFIDPEVSLTVTGPGGDVTVEALTIGGNNGIATLALNGGNLTSPSPISVTSTGVLAGDGLITGDVDNHGEVVADNVTITGDLDNHALVTFGASRLTVGGTLNNFDVIAGSGTIDGDLNNKASGEVRVGNGEALRFEGASNVNDGRIEPIGGEIEFDALLTNNAGGRVAGRNALLRFNGGLANSGQVQMTFGTSDVFGAINNAASGIVINSGNGNLTLYDDIQNDGELRTSTGATTVMFGEYTGTGTLTGTGSNFFEGGFSPGAIPFVTTATTDVNFGFSNTTLIELAGTTRGVGTASEYDGLDVLGGMTLNLDGILDVALINAFTPGAGDAFLLFTAGSIAGDFHTMNLPVLAAGLEWLVNNDGQNYGLSVVPLPGAVLLMVSALGGLLMARRI